MARTKSGGTKPDKIRIHEISPGYCTVSINGRSVRCSGYTISHEPDCLAELKILAHSDVVLEETGRVEWVAIPETIEEAIGVLIKAVRSGKITTGRIVNEILKRSTMMKVSDNE